MKIVEFNATIPRYAVGLTLGGCIPSVLWNGMSCTALREADPPALPAEDWLRVRTRYGGICGSDLSAIYLRVSPYWSPLYSFPHVLGHENVGRIAEVGSAAGDWQPGERVVVEPINWCRPRGFTELCRFCAKGEINRCERFTEGPLAPGIFIGGCRDTGGSWAASFVAHTTQLYRVPDEISDENAVMVEPFAVGLHAVLQEYPQDDETVLIVGAGSIGLSTLAALRGLGSKARIVVAARYPFQAQAARKLGASEVIQARRSEEIYQGMRELTGSHAMYTLLGKQAYLPLLFWGGSIFREVRAMRPLIGKQVIQGGADITYECVGTNESIDDSIRLTRSGGRLVLVGVPGVARGIDWTGIFAQELTLISAFAYHHAERYQGRRVKAFDLALELMSSGAVDLGWLVTHKFRIDQFAEVMEGLHNRTHGEVIKAVFEYPP